MACGEMKEVVTENIQRVNRPEGNNDEITNVTETETVGAILENSRLTEDEKTLTGVWESEEGWILGVRERALTDTSFALDAIIYYPEHDQWFKVTREDGSFVSEIESGLEFSDSHDCPSPDNPNMMVDTKEELIYDESSDSITFTSYYSGKTACWMNGSKVVKSIVFHRTDKDITEAEEGWDWYYDIEGGRDPR